MNHPPVLTTPAWVRTFKFATQPFDYMDAVSQRYGDIVSIPLGSTSLIMVSNPQGIRQMFTAREISAPGEFNRGMALMTGEQGLLQLDGHYHKHRRQLVMPSFHGNRMRTYGQRICDLTQQVMGQQPLSQPFRAYSTIEAIALQIILDVVLGLRNGHRYHQLRRLLPATLRQMLTPLLQLSFNFPVLQVNLGRWSPWGYLLHLRRSLYQLLEDEVRDRRQQPDLAGTDLLSELILARDQANTLLTHPEIRDLLLSPLFAGQDAVATAIAWALYWIHAQPTVCDRLLQELAELGDTPDPLDLAELPYLNAVCQEALRVYPTQVLTFMRRVEAPMELMSYPLTPGTLLVGNIYLTHQRPDLYPEPKQFRPERFLNRAFSSCEFLPFGGGLRSCIGGAFALFEMKLILGTILSHNSLALVDQRPERPRYKGIICYPASGVKLVKLEHHQRQDRSHTKATVTPYP
jgi:cytochrome P450 family 110